MVLMRAIVISRDEIDSRKRGNDTNVLQVIALVVVLLATSRPAAITRLIVAVIVDAIYRVFRGWLGPHVSQKVLVRSLPPLADCYSTTAIIHELAVTRIKAPGLHPSPSLVLARDGVARGGPMSFLCGGARNLCPKAPTM